MEQPPVISVTHRGPALRRGKEIAPINTKFEPKPVSRLQSLERPRPIETVIYEQPPSGGGLKPTDSHLDRRVSKGGLRSLFTRNKSTNEVKAEYRLENVTQEEDASELSIAKLIASTADSIGIAQVSTSTSQQPSPMHGSSKSPKIKTRSSAVEKEGSTRPLKGWHPPPLFQAYPQSMKHSHLSAPTTSVDTILKMDKIRRSSGGVTDGPSKPTKLARDGLSNGRQRMEEAAKKSKSRKDSIPQIEWTFKIYVLATSGVLLQYAGDGKYDRLPEKVLHLGKNSAAFASDVIPGKRWVLQVLQESTEDGTVATSKSVFSRLGFNNDLKKSVSSFLLVLESAEEMDAWLVAVRKEIEALGGKKYRPDMGVRKTTDEIVQQLQEKPSRRYLIKRDPNLYSNPRNSQSPSIDGYDQNNKEIDAATGKEYDPDSKRVNMNSWHSAAASSTTQATVSTDQAALDRLRESRRTSYASTDVRTYATSCDDSPASSPVTATAKSHPLTNERNTNGRLLPATEVANRRKCFQNLALGAHDQKIPLDLQPIPVVSRPRSINNTSQHQSPSPVVVTPNFSAPSFSKRYSHPIQTAPVPVPPVPPHPSVDRVLSPAQPSSPHKRPESIVGELPSTMRTSPKATRSRTAVNREIPSTINLSAAKNNSFQPYLSSNAFHSDPVNRRFSSLEYSTVAPSSRRHSPAPHPPPTSALPALPPADISYRPSSTPAPTFHKLRRPASMQVRSETGPKIRSMASHGKLPTSGAAALLYPKKKAVRSSLVTPSKTMPSIPVVKIEACTPEMMYGWAQVDGTRVRA